MDVAEITVLHLFITVRVGGLVTPAVIRRVPQHLQRVLCIEIVDQLAPGIVRIHHRAVAGFDDEGHAGVPRHVDGRRDQRQHGIPRALGDIPFFSTVETEQDLFLFGVMIRTSGGRRRAPCRSPASGIHMFDVQLVAGPVGNGHAGKNAG